MPDINDIPQFPKAHYEVTVGWNYLEKHLAHWADKGDENRLGGMNMNPDYQRAHVWTKQQQISYVEYCMQGGEVGKYIIWNCPTWGSTYQDPIELVDGKQRLEAVRSFLRGELPVFGHTSSEWTGNFRLHQHGFIFRVCNIKDRADILRLYLNINAGGTPHTAEEIAKVRDMLENLV